jgi:predicted transcriptional regulator
MSRILKEVIEHAEAWPLEDRRNSPKYAREIEARRTGIYTMSDDERAAVRLGLAEADRGEFVPDEVLAESDKRSDG